MTSHASHDGSNQSAVKHLSHGAVILATILNGLVPGLGLAYLGRWAFAAANFIIATTVLVGCFVGQNPTIMEHIHWVFLILIVGSAGIAHGMANSPS